MQSEIQYSEVAFVIPKSNGILPGESSWNMETLKVSGRAVFIIKVASNPVYLITIIYHYLPHQSMKWPRPFWYYNRDGLSLWFGSFGQLGLSQENNEEASDWVGNRIVPYSRQSSESRTITFHESILNSSPTFDQFLQLSQIFLSNVLRLYWRLDRYCEIYIIICKKKLFFKFLHACMNFTMACQFCCSHLKKDVREISELEKTSIFTTQLEKNLNFKLFIWNWRNFSFNSSV